MTTPKTIVSFIVAGMLCPLLMKGMDPEANRDELIKMFLAQEDTAPSLRDSVPALEYGPDGSYYSAHRSSPDEAASQDQIMVPPSINADPSLLPAPGVMSLEHGSDESYSLGGRSSADDADLHAAFLNLDEQLLQCLEMEVAQTRKFSELISNLTKSLDNLNARLGKSESDSRDATMKQVPLSSTTTQKQSPDESS